MSRGKRLTLMVALGLAGAGALAQPTMVVMPRNVFIHRYDGKKPAENDNRGDKGDQGEKAKPARAALPAPTPVPAAPPPLDHVEPAPLLEGPIVTAAPKVALPAEPALAPCDRPLAINLATALRLADARPIVIAAAQARVYEAAARLERAEVLWVPNANLGAYFYQHTGGAQIIVDGGIAVNSRNEFLAGAGLTTTFALTDAIFEPLSARQVLRSREFDMQAARNDVLLDVAEAYFSVQQARGRYAGYLDTVARSHEVLRRVEKLARNLTPPLEIDRVKAQLAEVEQAAVLGRQEWRIASANLTRLLRLDPSAVVQPLEPPHLQVTLISSKQPVDALIPVGLLSRPELASQQALVQATLERLRQEKMRPLIPSILLTGNGTPQFFFNGGIYGTGRHAGVNDWSGRSDVALQVVWQAENLGFGNRGRIRERDAQNQQAVLELFRIQDLVAAEVAQAHAYLESAAVRVDQAATGLDRALASYTGNLKGLSETTRFGDLLQLVIRPQEVVASLQALQVAYANYFLTIADYNRAQFRLFRAMGYPAHLIACERPPGEIVPVNPERPFKELPPVHAPEPCSGCAGPPAQPALSAQPALPAQLAPPAQPGLLAPLAPPAPPAQPPAFGEPPAPPPAKREKEKKDRLPAPNPSNDDQ